MTRHNPPSNPWLEDQRAKRRVKAKVWIRAHEHPNKRRAWRAVGHAMRAGKLTREDCQLQLEGCQTAPTQFHHTAGYDDPAAWLEGVWACRACHRVETTREVQRLHRDKNRERLKKLRIDAPGVVVLEE